MKQVSENKAPIVIFVYNRPEHTERTLVSLSNCDGASASNLFIFCDSAKRPEDKNSVNQVRSLVKSRKWCGDVQIIERDENWGLAKSIINGVTEVVKKYGRVIVLEDDLVVSKHFLNYMNDALNKYENEEQVMHIAGYMYPIDPSGLKETFFYRATSCWGWATWERAWKCFTPNVKGLVSQFTEELKYKFNIDGAHDFLSQIQLFTEGRIDAWAIRWYVSVFLKNGLCLHPARSLISNIGFDGTGIHCGKTNAFDVQIHDNRICEFDDTIEENEVALKRIRNYLKNIRPLHVRILSKLKNALCRYC